MIKNIDKSVCFLIILMPIFLVTGPFLSDLSVVIIDLAFLIIIFKEKKQFYVLNNKYFKFLIILWIYFSLRSLFADDIFLSFKSSFSYVRFIFLIWAISFFLERNKKLFDKFSKVFLLVIGFVILDAVIQYFIGTNVLGFKIQNTDKLNGLFNDEAVLGSYLVRFTPLIFAVLYCYFDTKKFSIFYLFVLSFLGFTIFISGSRSSIFLFIMFGFLFFLTNINLRKIIIFTFLINLLGLISLSHFNDKVFYSIHYNFFDPIRTIFFEDKKAEDANKIKKIYIFTKVYDSHYNTAYNMYLDNKLFGVGTKMYRKLCQKEKYYVNEFSCTTHPHNFYFQLLAENGLIGFFGILTIFIYTLIIIFKKIYYINFQKDNIVEYSSLMILIGLFINFWPVVPSGNFFNNWLSIMIFFPLGFLKYFIKRKI
jgi:O-antigen ligase